MSLRMPLPLTTPAHPGARTRMRATHVLPAFAGGRDPEQRAQIVALGPGFRRDERVKKVNQLSIKHVLSRNLIPR